MKACPHCAEQIQDAAIVCKHCGRSLVPTEVRAAKGLLKWTAYAVVLIVLAVALPSIWEAVTTGNLTQNLGGCSMYAETIDGRRQVNVKTTYDFVHKELALDAMPSDFSPPQAQDVIRRCTEFLRPKTADLTISRVTLKYQTKTVDQER